MKNKKAVVTTHEPDEVWFENGFIEINYGKSVLYTSDVTLARLVRRLMNSLNSKAQVSNESK